MPSLYRRRIFRVGNSKGISLPPPWLKYFNLDVGDEVELICDNEIKIRPIQKREAKK